MTRANGWESLEVRHLRAFQAVARTGSFAAAADELGYTQSAISQQLRALERIVDSPLLQRFPGGRRPVELTQAGRVLLTHADSLLARVQATEADIAAVAAGEHGRVAVATIQSVGARILPGVLARHRAQHAQVDVDIREMPTVADLLEAVETGQVDAGFTALPVPEGPFEVQALMDDPYVLATQTGAPEQGLTDLDGKRLLGIRGCAHDQLIEQRLLAEGIVPAGIERYDDNTLIEELVATGAGVAVVPQLTMDRGDSRISLHPLPTLPSRKLVVVVHHERSLSPAARSLIEFAVESARLRPEPRPGTARLRALSAAGSC